MPCSPFLSLVCIIPLLSISASPIKDKIEDAMESAKKRVLDAEFDKADKDHSESLTKMEFQDYVLANELVNLPRPTKTAAEFASSLELPISKTKGSQDHSFDSDPTVSEDFKQAFDKIEDFGVAFWSAFFKSVAMIIATELGDKTFFIAAIMAMKHSRTLVYTGAVGALALMTVLSVAIGFALPTLLPKAYTHYAAVALFAYFGFKLLYEAYEMYKEPPEKNEELEEVEVELGKGINGKNDDGGHKNFMQKNLKRIIPAVFAQAFALTFLAEWGDRSQIATIALASSKDPFGVTIGGTLGHAMCTGLAVVGGRLLATKISEQQVAFFGGILFWVFAIHEFW
eukprot:CAMPEP_0184478340 /NCGR_PEP_ID=MMETSP0113_2-20130426/401_1 /TAXON_ID=91329 /ORGANISM="Norrisiella sphaerica, Strain BC52" /LENGTH=340 /DNA_ID=CAMNT_0026856099 /DNA_START=97 /DNA_END=1116 /DNA_ORIENTATION=+